MTMKKMMKPTTTMQLKMKRAQKNLWQHLMRRRRFSLDGGNRPRMSLTLTTNKMKIVLQGSLLLAGAADGRTDGRTDEFTDKRFVVFMCVRRVIAMAWRSRRKPAMERKEQIVSPPFNKCHRRTIRYDSIRFVTTRQIRFHHDTLGYDDSSRHVG